MSFSLKLFGGATLITGDGPAAGPALQRHRLALLSLLAAAHPRAVSRDKLVAALWPERDAEHGRNLLNQAVYALRQALGTTALHSTGDDLQLDPAVVATDVIAFEQALAAGEDERAADLYAGPFLDGFFLDDAAEFERRVDRERDRYATAYARAVERLAEAAEQAREPDRAVQWWKRRAAHDPYDSRVAFRLMQALERAGNRAAALQHAAGHLHLLKEELGIAAPPEVVAAMERLRTAPGSSRALEISDDPRSRRAAPAPASALGAPGSTPAWRRLAVYGGIGIVAAGVALAVIRLAAGRSESPVIPAPAVVDEIAQAVARELERRAHGDTLRKLPALRTLSIPAYEAYLRGNDPTLLRSDSGARRGLDYFRQAVTLDSGYAAAWAGLARMTLRVAVDSDVAAMREARTRAEAAARKAVALDDSLAEAHAILGMMRAMAYDFLPAEDHLRRAVALDPTRARLREWLASFYLLVDRPAEALAEAQRALALEPLSPSATAEVARALMANDRCDEALTRLAPLAALDPPLLRVAPIAAQCYGRQGRWAEAVAALRPPSGREDPRTLPLLGYLLARSGKREEAVAIQERLTDRWRQGAAGAFDLVFVPAGLGDRATAFAWLDRAVEDGSLGLFPGWRAFTSAPFDELRQDPRMTRLRARLGIQNR
jgi:DNA-binding SARP family transcriptional activator